METLLKEVQKELSNLVPKTINFYKQRDCVITEGYCVEDIAVMLLILNSINTERMAVTFYYLYKNDLCKETYSGNRNIVLDSSTGLVEINYRSRRNKEIEILGDYKDLKKMFEVILNNGI
jgi:hypothetical protein